MDNIINEEAFKEILNIVLKAGYNQAVSDAAELIDEKARLKHTVEATRYHQQLASDVRKLSK